MNDANHCKHGTPLTLACIDCEADVRASRLDAVRKAAETPHTNASVTAGGLVVLCELLPNDPTAGKLHAIARANAPETAMIVTAGAIRALLRKVDESAPKPEPEPEPEPPEEAA